MVVWKKYDLVVKIGWRRRKKVEVHDTQTLDGFLDRKLSELCCYEVKILQPPARKTFII